MVPSRTPLSTLACAAALAATAAHAQGSWPGCADVAANEIKATPIVTRATHALEEPMKMAFESVAQPGEDAKGKVNIYFTERKGKLRKFDAAKNQVVQLAQFTLSVGATSSDGLLGIALDPGFKSNHHLYLYYTAGSGASATWRVSRFTLDAAHETLDKTTERILLDIPIQIGSQHPGGALAFDAYGNLYITTGDNHMPAGSDFLVHTSANTNDLRAKILRIRPRPDGSGYDIPEGNLFKPGTAKTRPEIYVMGNRNPYTITVDPVRRWVMWGDVGPDDKNFDGQPMNQSGSTDMTEEYNLATAAGNFGYPFFAGKNFVLRAGTNPSAPALPAGVNWNGAQEGLAVLPAAQPAIKAYRKACAITGPIYRYDGDLNSSVKLPPHFHRKWFTTDFNTNAINLYTLNADGSAITGEAQVFKGVVTLDRPLDMQMGPDGALYVNNYAGYRTVTAGTSIIRIEYTGACRPAEPKLETVGLVAREGGSPTGPLLEVRPGRVLEVSVASAGDFRLEVRDVLGRPVAFRSGRGKAVLALPEIAKAGVYVVTARAPEGESARRIVRP